MVMASKAAKKPKRAAATKTVDARVQKQALQREVRLQKEIVGLSRSLERRIRSSDERLMELGAVLLDRASRVFGGRKAAAPAPTVEQLETEAATQA